MATPSGGGGSGGGGSTDPEALRRQVAAFQARVRKEEAANRELAARLAAAKQDAAMARAELDAMHAAAAGAPTGKPSAPDIVSAAIADAVAVTTATAAVSARAGVHAVAMHRLEEEVASLRRVVAAVATGKALHEALRWEVTFAHAPEPLREFCSDLGLDDALSPYPYTPPAVVPLIDAFLVVGPSYMAGLELLRQRYERSRRKQAAAEVAERDSDEDAPAARGRDDDSNDDEDEWGDEAELEAEVLYSYPPTAPLASASIPMFAFPEGVIPKPLDPLSIAHMFKDGAEAAKREGGSATSTAAAGDDGRAEAVLRDAHNRELLFGKRGLRRGPRSHIFVLQGTDTDDGEAMAAAAAALAAGKLVEGRTRYGVCLQVSEPLTRTAAAGLHAKAHRDGGDVPAAPVADVYDDMGIALPRVFILVSRYPFFPLHFDLLRCAVALWQHGHVQMLARLVSRGYHGSVRPPPSHTPPPPPAAAPAASADPALVTLSMDRWVAAGTDDSAASSAVAEAAVAAREGGSGADEAIAPSAGVVSSANPLQEALRHAEPTATAVAPSAPWPAITSAGAMSVASMWRGASTMMGGWGGGTGPTATVSATSTAPSTTTASVPAAATAGGNGGAGANVSQLWSAFTKAVAPTAAAATPATGDARAESPAPFSNVSGPAAPPASAAPSSASVELPDAGAHDAAAAGQPPPSPLMSPLAALTRQMSKRIGVAGVASPPSAASSGGSLASPPLAASGGAPGTGGSGSGGAFSMMAALLSPAAGSHGAGTRGPQPPHAADGDDATAPPPPGGTHGPGTTSIASLFGGMNLRRLAGAAAPTPAGTAAGDGHAGPTAASSMTAALASAARSGFGLASLGSLGRSHGGSTSSTTAFDVALDARGAAAGTTAAAAPADAGDPLLQEDVMEGAAAALSSALVPRGLQELIAAYAALPVPALGATVELPLPAAAVPPEQNAVGTLYIMPRGSGGLAVAPPAGPHSHLAERRRSQGHAAGAVRALSPPGQLAPDGATSHARLSYLRDTVDAQWMSPPIGRSGDATVAAPSESSRSTVDAATILRQLDSDFAELRGDRALAPPRDTTTSSAEWSRGQRLVWELVSPTAQPASVAVPSPASKARAGGKEEVREEGASAPAPSSAEAALASSAEWVHWWQVGCDLDHPETCMSLSRWAAPILFSMLPIDSVMLLLGAALVEQKIIVVGGQVSQEVVSCCVLALASLLRPLSWVGPLLPTVPMHLRELLYAPIPVLLGVAALPPDYEQDEHTVIVLLDCETVRIPAVRTEGEDGDPHGGVHLFPGFLELQLPDNSVLYRRLEPLSSVLRLGSGSGSGARISRNRVRPCYKPTAAQMAAASTLVQALNAHVRRLLYRLFAAGASSVGMDFSGLPPTHKPSADATRSRTGSESAPSSATSPLSAAAVRRLPPLQTCAAAVLESVPEVQAPFWAQFVATQMVSYFYESRVSQLQAAALLRQQRTSSDATPAAAADAADGRPTQPAAGATPPRPPPRPGARPSLGGDDEKGVTAAGDVAAIGSATSRPPPAPPSRPLPPSLEEAVGIDDDGGSEDAGASADASAAASNPVAHAGGTLRPARPSMAMLPSALPPVVLGRRASTAYNAGVAGGPRYATLRMNATAATAAGMGMEVPTGTPGMSMAMLGAAHGVGTLGGSRRTSMAPASLAMAHAAAAAAAAGSAGGGLMGMPAVATASVDIASRESLHRERAEKRAAAVAAASARRRTTDAVYQRGGGGDDGGEGGDGAATSPTPSPTSGLTATSSSAASGDTSGAEAAPVPAGGSTSAGSVGSLAPPVTSPGITTRHTRRHTAAFVSPLIGGSVLSPGGTPAASAGVPRPAPVHRLAGGGIGPAAGLPPLPASVTVRQSVGVPGGVAGRSRHARAVTSSYLGDLPEPTASPRTLRHRDPSRDSAATGSGTDSDASDDDGGAAGAGVAASQRVRVVPAAAASGATGPRRHARTLTAGGLAVPPASSGADIVVDVDTAVAAAMQEARDGWAAAASTSVPAAAHARRRTLLGVPGGAGGAGGGV